MPHIVLTYRYSWNLQVSSRLSGDLRNVERRMAQHKCRIRTSKVIYKSLSLCFDNSTSDLVDFTGCVCVSGQATIYRFVMQRISHNIRSILPTHE